MADDSYDVIILGGGNAGFGVSAICAEAGKSIAIIEDQDWGGVCPNRGCTPKKVLVAAAQALHDIAAAPAHGISTGAVRLDWSQLIDRERAMIGFIPGAMKGLAGKRGTAIDGRARFVGRNTVSVNGRVLEGRHIVIATGSRPRPLTIPGAEFLITSDEVLSERTQPASVVFIGGGVIALEFAHVYARAGTHVTILEMMPRLLPRIEEEAVAQVRQESERIGITVETGVTVHRVERVGGALRVTYTVGGAERTVEAERIVNGAGRIANVDDIGLEAADVAHDGLRVQVDATLRSVSNPSVFVCGDALWSTPQLSPIATYEGRVVGRNIVDGGGHVPDYTGIASCVYTVPALATVGLSEAEAKDRGLSFRKTVNDMSGWFSGKSYAETVAWAKVLIEEGTDRILGAHMVGHRGEDLIHVFAMAMKFNITAAQIKDMVFGYPTFTSDVKNLL